MLIKTGNKISNCKILILGVTFKENCPDIRNSKVIDVYNELNEFGINVDIFDYEASALDLEQTHQIRLLPKITEKYDGILVAVAHKEFSSIDIKSLKRNSNSIVYDLKGVLPKNIVDSRL